MDTIKIGEIAQIKSGIFCKNADRGSASYYQIRDYNEDNSNFETDHKIVLNKFVKNHLLHNQDLILTAKGRKYYCTIYNTVSKQKAVASNAFFILRAFDPQICPEYLCWYLNRPEISWKLQIQGKNYFFIRKEAIEDLPIPIIDKNIQMKIYTMFHQQNEALKLQRRLLQESQSNLLKLLNTASYNQ